MTTHEADARPMLGSHMEVGAVLPALRFSVTQETMDRYARASGDFNPIHVDPEFARTGPFGRTIAHGLMTLAFVARMLNAWSGGAFDSSGEIDITFIAPVYAGDEVCVGGTIEEIMQRDGTPALRIKLSCTAGERQILAGSAIQPSAHAKEA